MSDANRHVVAIFGGACAGSTAADILAAHGVEVVVFEQNTRPYGKIEDGLPRWHRDQRRMEYKRIDGRLDRPGVHFVPRTRLGADLQFEDVVRLGIQRGAARQRRVARPPARHPRRRCLARSRPRLPEPLHLLVQPRPRSRLRRPPLRRSRRRHLHRRRARVDRRHQGVPARTVRPRAGARAASTCSMHDLEHAGIPATCQKHGIADPATLGVEDGWLVYRRRVEDMPLATAAARRHARSAPEDRGGAQEDAREGAGEVPLPRAPDGAAGGAAHRGGSRGRRPVRRDGDARRQGRGAARIVRSICAARWSSARSAVCPSRCRASS